MRRAGVRIVVQDDVAGVRVIAARHQGAHDAGDVAGNRTGLQRRGQPALAQLAVSGWQIVQQAPRHPHWWRLQTALPGPVWANRSAGDRYG